MNYEKKLNLFKEFLKTNQVLIIDKSSASRRRLTKTIVDMGGKRNLVHSVAHFQEAVDIINEHKPQLVLSDFDLKGGSGFDLFKEYRDTLPDEKKATLILITSNISQSAVAKAAEEDVDSFIIKPYTVKSLEKSLVKAVIAKLHPSNYIKKIDEGKELLVNKEFEKALEVFKEAVQLHKKPSLALFYEGQAKYFLEMKESAQSDYKEGLSFNSIHYKCQIGLYELLMSEKRHLEAYEVVKNIAKYFPANPDRLQEVIRLAMITENYADMDQYYEIFVNLDHRTDSVVNYVCSGLYILGKFYFQNALEKKGRDIFEKVGVSCAGRSKFLRAMINELVKYRFHDDAQRLLSRFPAGENESEDYLVSEYLAQSAEAGEANNIQNGLGLINKGIKDYQCFKIMINAMRAEGYSDKVAEYETQAKALWPERFVSKEKEAA
jgi:CheY-like chemotaxis protein